MIVNPNEPAREMGEPSGTLDSEAGVPEREEVGRKGGKRPNVDETEKPDRVEVETQRTSVGPRIEEFPDEGEPIL